MSKYQQYIASIVIDDNFQNTDSELPFTQQIAIVAKEVLIGFEEKGEVDYGSIIITTSKDENNNIVATVIARIKD